jgi:hypothetical protein
LVLWFSYFVKLDLSALDPPFIEGVLVSGSDIGILQEPEAVAVLPALVALLIDHWAAGQRVSQAAQDRALGVMGIQGLQADLAVWHGLFRFRRSAPDIQGYD